MASAFVTVVISLLIIIEGLFVFVASFNYYRKFVNCLWLFLSFSECAGVGGAEVPLLPHSR